MSMAELVNVIHESTDIPGDAAAYCLGSLLWSAVFFVAGYLTAAVVQVYLGRRHHDHS